MRNTAFRTRTHSSTAPSRAGAKLPLLLASAAALAGMAAYVAHRTKKAERDNPPAGKFAYVDDVRLHYLDRGEGQPVVLLHGNGTMAQDFDIAGVVDGAARKYRVLAFDRPGYGYSTRPAGKVWTPEAQAEVLYRALRQLDVRGAIVVGHSWGTLVALALARLYPQAVGSLVLLSGYYYPTARLDAALLSPPAIPGLGHIMRYTVSPLLGRLMWPAMVRRMFSPSETAPRFAARYPVWMSLRPLQLKASAAEAALMVPCAYQYSGHYGGVRLPVVIMAGSDDKVVRPHWHSERLHGELPDSELLLVPETGHMIQQTAPGRVLEAIDRAAARMAEAPTHATSWQVHMEAAAPLRVHAS